MYYSDESGFKEANGHEVNGEWYPRVTSIVSIKAKPELYRYYAGLANFAEGEAIKKQSADEGTMVHSAVEALLLGESPEFDSLISPSVEAFLEFQTHAQIKVLPDWVERKILSSEERYSGTVDSVAIIDGKLGILDIKTSQSIYRDYNLQTSAYFTPLLEEYGLEKLSTRWILRIDQAQTCLKCGATLRKKGGKERIKSPLNGNGNGFRGQFSKCEHEWADPKGIIELKECPNWESDYRAFIGAKRLWEWENDAWLKRIGYL